MKNAFVTLSAATILSQTAIASEDMQDSIDMASMKCELVLGTEESKYCIIDDVYYKDNWPTLDQAEVSSFEEAREFEKQKRFQDDFQKTRIIEAPGETEGLF